MTHVPPENWIDINEPRTVKYDVYSFAVLLWELLAEQQPFEEGITHYLAYMFDILVTATNLRGLRELIHLLRHRIL